MDSGKESPSRLLGLWWNRIVIVIMKSFRRQKWLKIVAKRKGLRKLFQLCSSLIILKGKGRSNFVYNSVFDNVFPSTNTNS